jgi:hypothetical protein
VHDAARRIVVHQVASGQPGDAMRVVGIEVDSAACRDRAQQRCTRTHRTRIDEIVVPFNSMVRVCRRACQIVPAGCHGVRWRGGRIIARVMRSLAILVALAGMARADPETTHYYQYTLPGDAVALALYSAGQMTEQSHATAANALTALGVVGSLLSTPIVHTARGHWKRGVTSFALRAGLALIGGEVARAGAQCPEDACLRDREMVGAGIGFALATVIDAALLTEEKVPAPPTWSPTVTARSGGIVLGVGRVF